MNSNNLKKIRKKQRYTVSELARRTNLSRVTITNIENQKVTPRIDTAFLIAQELGVDVTSIFFTPNVNHE